MNSRIKFFIVASVLMNLLLAGVVAVHVSHHFMGERGGASHVQHIIAKLPDDKRALFETTMATLDQQSEVMRNSINDSRKESTRLLKAETFDKSAYIASVKKGVYVREQLIELTATKIIELADQFSPQEREILADAMQQRWKERNGPHPEIGERK